MAEDEERGTRSAGMAAPLIETAGMIVAPLRTAALIALGGSALMAEAARRRVSYATNEGERQLELFSGSFRRTTARFWRRRGPHPAASSGRSSRTTAAG
jgi:hypothetical protein